MSNDRTRINRRKFLQSSALGAAAAASGTLAAPQLLRAQGAGVKLGNERHNLRQHFVIRGVLVVADLDVDRVLGAPGRSQGPEAPIRGPVERQGA